MLKIERKEYISVIMQIAIHTIWILVSYKIFILSNKSTEEIDKSNKFYIKPLSFILILIIMSYLLYYLFKLYYTYSSY